MNMKEKFRKLLVSIKRNPQAIPLLALAISFVYYSFNLTYISQTTSLINEKHMGLASFVTMLLSILSFVCILNAFPKRKKPNIFMVWLFTEMSLAVIFADFYYYYTVAGSTIEITEQRAFVPVAEKIANNHIIFVIVTMIITILEPLIAKLLRKINTSIDVEDNGSIESIDITDEE